LVEVLPVLPPMPEAPPLRERVAPAVLPSVGNSPAWLLATAAWAARRRAAAWAMLWLPVAACCCRRLSCSSPNSSHQRSGTCACDVSAGRQMPASAASGVASLNWAGTSSAGRW
jgi:hypothetical protein